MDKQRPETLRFKQVFTELKRREFFKGYADFADKVGGTKDQIANIFKANARHNATPALINGMLKAWPDLNPDYIWNGTGDIFKWESANKIPAVNRLVNEWQDVGYYKARYIPPIEIPELLNALANKSADTRRFEWLHKLDTYPLIDLPPVSARAMWPKGETIAIQADDDSMAPPIYKGSVSYFVQYLSGYHPTYIRMIPGPDKPGGAYLLITDKGFYFGLVNYIEESSEVTIQFENPEYPPIKLDAVSIYGVYLWIGASISTLPAWVRMHQDKGGEEKTR